MELLQSVPRVAIETLHTFYCHIGTFAVRIVLIRLGFYSLQLIVVVYVVVIVWLVSSDFRSAAAAKSARISRYVNALWRRATWTAKPRHSGSKSEIEEMLDEFNELNDVDDCSFDEIDADEDDDDDEEDDDDYQVVGEITETEAMVVVQGASGNRKPRCTTHFEDDFEGDPV